MKEPNVTYPTWLITLYVIAVAVLVPWIIYLAFTLPIRQVARHWDAAWVGFDMFMLFLVILTAFFAYRKSARLIPTASSLATILIIDAWFDVITSRPGLQQLESVFFAVCIELPFAFITFLLVHRAVSQVNWNQQKTIVVGEHP